MVLLEEEDEGSLLLDGFVKRAEKLGMFPELAMKVRDVINNPNASAQDLERAVSQDAGLTAQVLRLANSPFYGGRRTVTSVRHALVVMGFRDASHLALAQAMTSREPTSELARALVADGLRAAVVARELSRHTRAVEPSEAYVAGMLHDFGAVVLLEAFGDPYAAIIGDPTRHGAALLAAEREMTETDHCEVGEACFMAWHFARSTSLSTRFHHQPVAQASLDGWPTFCGDALLAVTDWVVRGVKAGQDRASLAMGIVKHRWNEPLEINDDHAKDAVENMYAELAAL